MRPHGARRPRPRRRVVPALAPSCGDEEWVDCPDFRLARRIRTDADTLVADYRLTATPGYRFLWAAHALLDVSPHATLTIPDGTATRLYPDDGSRWTAGAWPLVDDVPLDRLGPDDGTAVGAVVTTAQVSVHDGRDTLHLSVESPDHPVSVALWRNLAGLPGDRPVPLHRRRTDAGPRLRPVGGGGVRHRAGPRVGGDPLAPDDQGDDGWACAVNTVGGGGGVPPGGRFPRRPGDPGPSAAPGIRCRTHPAPGPRPASPGHT